MDNRKYNEFLKRITPEDGFLKTSVEGNKIFFQNAHGKILGHFHKKLNKAVLTSRKEVKLC